MSPEEERPGSAPVLMPGLRQIWEDALGSVLPAPKCLRIGAADAIRSLVEADPLSFFEERDANGSCPEGLGAAPVLQRTAPESWTFALLLPSGAQSKCPGEVADAWRS